MPDATVIPIARETPGSAAIDDPSTYARLYAASIRDPERFWTEHGRSLDWIKPYSRARDISYGPGEVRGIKRVPVIREGRLVGIVSRANLIRAPAQEHSKIPHAIHLTGEPPCSMSMFDIKNL